MDIDGGEAEQPAKAIADGGDTGWDGDGGEGGAAEKRTALPMSGNAAGYGDGGGRSSRKKASSPMEGRRRG